jgi:hypothetical protein
LLAAVRVGRALFGFQQCEGIENSWQEYLGRCLVADGRGVNSVVGEHVLRVVFEMRAQGAEGN